MADLSNNSSFIPKRGPVKRKHNSNTRQVYFFTLVSYILMFATLLGVGAVYFYDEYTEKQLNKEIASLDNEINSFNEADMLKVKEFNSRLSQAETRINKGVSVVSVFEALEESTIDTVEISSLRLKRELDDKFILEAEIHTDSFDSTIFQRDIYNRHQKIDSIIVGDVLTNDSDQNLENQTDQGDIPEVQFSAEIHVPFSTIPYEPERVVSEPVSVFETEIIESESDETLEDQEINQENI